MRRCRLLVLALACALAAAGCARLDLPGLESEPAPRHRWEQALALLEAGKEDQAEAELALLRAESPAYRERARRMLAQIREPVREYFPQSHFNVRLREGQSLSSLSARYLGDPLRFYALARYNGIRRPAEVAVGQLIRIPMTEQARAVRRRETGSPDADDPIDDTAGRGRQGDRAGAVAPAHEDAGTATDTESPAQTETQSKADAKTGGDARTADGDEPPPAEDAVSARDLERIKRLYREATVAFQRQDLDGTLRYCRRVLELDPDHANCRDYRDRARELLRQLDRIEQEEEREQAG